MASLNELISKRLFFEAKQLFETGADVYQKGTDNLTPLHLAIERGNRPVSDLVELLLKKGADPNAKTRSGSTPLHYVAC